MKSSIITLAALLTVLFYLGSCARRTPLGDLSSFESSEEWVAALRSRSQYWHQFQATANISCESPQKRINLEALIVAKVPNQLRLEAFRFGQTAGVLTLDQSQSSLFVPSEKTLYTADQSSRMTEHLFGFSMPLEPFAYCLTATVPAAQLVNFYIIHRDTRWQAASQDHTRGWNLIWEFLARPPALSTVTLNGETFPFMIGYDPPVRMDIEKEHPDKLVFQSGQWRVTVQIRELKPLALISEDAFQMNVSGGIRQVNLNELP